MIVPNVALFRDHALKRNDFIFESPSRFSFLQEHDLSENRYPLFGIML